MTANIYIITNNLDGRLTMLFLRVWPSWADFDDEKPMIPPRDGDLPSWISLASVARIDDINVSTWCRVMTNVEPREWYYPASVENLLRLLSAYAVQHEPSVGDLPEVEG